jgi:hypothetical protein
MQRFTVAGRMAVSPKLSLSSKPPPLPGLPRWARSPCCHAGRPMRRRPIAAHRPLHAPVLRTALPQGPAYWVPPLRTRRPERARDFAVWVRQARAAARALDAGAKHRCRRRRPRAPEPPRCSSRSLVLSWPAQERAPPTLCRQESIVPVCGLEHRAHGRTDPATHRACSPAAGLCDRVPPRGGRLARPMAHRPPQADPAAWTRGAKKPAPQPPPPRIPLDWPLGSMRATLASERKLHDWHRQTKWRPRRLTGSSTPRRGAAG